MSKGRHCIELFVFFVFAITLIGTNSYDNNHIRTVLKIGILLYLRLVKVEKPYYYYMVDNTSGKKEIAFLKQVELKAVDIKLRSDGIMQFDIKPCENFTVNDLKEANTAADNLGDGKIFQRLVFVNHFIRFDKEVRKYGATEESNKNVAAVAFVTNLLALKFIGNFYISFNKPVRLTQIFDSEVKALEWLKSLTQV